MDQVQLMPAYDYKFSANTRFGIERHYELGELKTQSGSEPVLKELEIQLPCKDSVFKQKVPGTWFEIESEFPNTKAFQESPNGYLLFVTIGIFNESARDVDQVARYWLDSLISDGTAISDLRLDVIEQSGGTPHEVQCAFLLGTRDEYYGRYNTLVVNLRDGQSWVMFRFLNVGVDSVAKFDEVVLSTRTLRTYT